MAKKKKTFESSLERIEEIIAAIEDHQITLEESLKLYREGVELSAFCMQNLNEVEKEVLLLSNTADGTLTVTPFESMEV